jgi:hypothetical protein
MQLEPSSDISTRRRASEPLKFATKAPYFEMLGKFFKVLSNNVAVTGANAGPVTILDLLEIVGPLPKGTRGSAWRCRTPRSLSPRLSKFRPKPATFLQAD